MERSARFASRDSISSSAESVLVPIRLSAHSTFVKTAKMLIFSIVDFNKTLLLRSLDRLFVVRSLNAYPFDFSVFMPEAIHCC